MSLSKYLLIVLLVAGLCACDSTNHTTSMMLDNPLRDRQISSFDQSTLFVDVTVNNGAAQTIVVPPGVFPTVGVAGIIPNSTNTIFIRWYEVLDGVEINLATQMQSFMSGGSVIIDATHESAQYDNDNDGISNLAERINGTCVFDATNDCSELSTGIAPDVFVTSAFAQGGVVVGEGAVNSAVRTVLSDDFTLGIGNWSSSDPIQEREGAMCVDFLGGGPTGVQDLLAFYASGTFRMEPGTHILQYDLRVVNRSMPLTIGITYDSPNFLQIFDHYVQGTNQWTTHTLQFTNSVTTDTANMGIFAIQSPFDTTYCIDNVLLVQL